jgi:Tol biopolymer transport system component
MRSSSLRAAAAFAVLGLTAPASAGAWPGLNGRIAVTQDPRTKDVFALALDGASTQLTLTGNDEQQPSWAPDGRRIAFKRSDEVFIRDVTTTAAPLRLTFGPGTENNTQPAWSPDGRRIVFRTNRTTPEVNVADIWIMNADGTDQRPLIVQDDDQRYPTFSPDGARLSYTSRNAQGNADLWVADADGTGARMVYDSGQIDSAPAWSPDGSKLAFESGPELQRDLFVLELGDGSVTRLTDHPAHDEGPAWSPDGTMLAFTSTRDAAPRQGCTGCENEIYVIRADGTGLTRLTTNAILDESPDWQAIPSTLSPAIPCGATVTTDNERHCNRARRLAGEWTPETPGCTRTSHSFNQALVECGDQLAFVQAGIGSSASGP